MEKKWKKNENLDTDRKTTLKSSLKGTFSHTQGTLILSTMFKNLSSRYDDITSHKEIYLNEARRLGELFLMHFNRSKMDLRYITKKYR